jgi:hypothetical protein
MYAINRCGAIPVRHLVAEDALRQHHAGDEQIGLRPSFSLAADREVPGLGEDEHLLLEADAFPRGMSLRQQAEELHPGVQDVVVVDLPERGPRTPFVHCYSCTGPKFRQP